MREQPPTFTQKVKKFLGLPDQQNRFGAGFDYTQGAHEMAREQGNPEGTFDGYRIIGRDTPINEGVYFIKGDAEILLVDDGADGGWLKQNERFLLARLITLSKTQRLTESVIISEAYKLARQLMPFNEDAVKQKVGHLKEYTKLHLKDFAGGGVCRHQALLCGYLLERLYRTGRLKGSASVDRSLLPYKGHAWVRYTTEAGQVIIVDPARDPGVLILDDLPEMQPDRVFYERPGEYPDKIMYKSERLETRLVSRARRMGQTVRSWFLGKVPPRSAAAA